MFRSISFMAVMLSLSMVTANTFADTPPVVNTNIYDATGNLVSGDGRYYEYNDANQLTRVRQENMTGAILSEYFYDSSGQRIKKIENGVVTYYIGKHFEKQVGGVTPGTTSYYFGDDGERVAKKDPAGQIYYYHLDHLDGINAVTNSAGTAVATTDYLPFGDQRTGATGNEKYAYTGKEQDKTGLYYFDARYNSPEFRHFTQADIAEPDYDDPQDLNRYAYVGNNPLSYIDPDGFKKKKKSKKKKAKLSKREKWMIAHGSDPDHDKTSLKKAKKQFKAGEKYTLPAPQYGSSMASRGQYGFSSGIVAGENVFQNYENSSSAINSSLYRTALLNAAKAYQQEADSWNNYANLLENRIRRAKIIKFGADAAMFIGGLMTGGATEAMYATGISVLYSGFDNALTLHQAFTNKLSSGEMLEEAAKLTVEVGALKFGVLGEAFSFGINAGIDLAHF